MDYVRGYLSLFPRSMRAIWLTLMRPAGRIGGALPWGLATVVHAVAAAAAIFYWWVILSNIPAVLFAYIVGHFVVAPLFGDDES